VLWPLGRKLAEVALPAPPSAESSLQQACSTLNVAFPCPRLFILPAESGRKLQTLPLEAGGRIFGIFASGGLLDVAKPVELAALLAREVALLKNYRLHVPGRWAVLQSLQLKPQLVRRKAAVGGSWLEGAAQATSGQLVQLCRVHHGVSLMDAHAGALPQELASAWRGASNIYRRALPPLLAGVADVVAVHHDGSWWPALMSSAVKLQSFARQKQFGTLWRITKLCGEVSPGAGVDLSRRAMNNNIKSLRLTYKVGPERIERLLAFAAHAKHPGRWFQKLAKKAPNRAALLAAAVPWRSLLMASAAVRRAAELAADRSAAHAVGDFRPVVAGLVLIHGTAEERRRLQRGDLAGLVEDARAEEVPAKRWGTWLTSAIEARPLPPLRLRIAELAAWAESAEGRRQLVSFAEERGQSWRSWLISLPRRSWDALPSLRR